MISITSRDSATACSGLTHDVQRLDSDVEDLTLSVLFRGALAMDVNSTDTQSTALGTTTSDASDGDLVAALAARHERAFAELFRRHNRSVTACSRTILGNRTACEDVAADVFIGLWRNPTKFDASRGSLLSYLRMQAKGRSIDLIRAESARAIREKSEGRRSWTPDEDVGSGVLASEAATQLREALALLSATEREAIELAFFSGMTYSAVAHHLGLAEGTVKSRIRKGLERLRSSYESTARSTTEDRELADSIDRVSKSSLRPDTGE